MTQTPSFQEVPCRLFARAGRENTEAVLEIVRKRAAELALDTVVLATCSGWTAFEALRLLAPGTRIVAVTHITGWAKPDEQELSAENRQALEAQGVRLYTGTHAFGGVGRAVRNKLHTYQVDEIMAFTLRLFGQGTKVAVEIALMAADAGLIRTDRDVIAVGGSGQGADTALVLRPANASRLFDLRVREILCKPSVF